MLCIKCGQDKAKKNGSGRVVCANRINGKQHSYSYALQEEAEQAMRGIAPSYGVNNPLPAGFKMNGFSTLTKNDRGEPQWIKATADKVAQENALLGALDAMVADLPRIKPRKALGKYAKDQLALYPIGDAHIGMRAWKGETGQDWDLEIAKRVHGEAIKDLVERSPACDTAIVANMGDFFHYDSMIPETPRSRHPVTSDGRWYHMIEVGVTVMRQAIESALQKHKNVIVICVKGNHDSFSAGWLNTALSNVYEKEKRVTLVPNPSLFNYYRFGVNLLGFHHGHACKMQMLPGVMANDKARDWGETIHRTWHLGHVHHDSVKEYQGVTVETHGILAPADGHSHESGYRSRQSMKAIIYDKDYGPISRFMYYPQLVKGD